MKTHHPKLKTPPCTLFSCGFFGQCTQTVLSPTTPHPPPLSLHQSEPQPPSPSLPPPSPPPLPLPTHADPPTLHQDSSSTSSSSTSQSFTQWRFPLSNSPLLDHHHRHPQESDPPPSSHTQSESHFLPEQPPYLFSNLQELFQIAELQLTTGSVQEGIPTLHLLERSLVPHPQPDLVCPSELMRGIVRYLKNRAGAKSATKVLLALCLGERNRHVAVEVRAAGEVVESVMEMENTAAERALAALELMCTVEEGAAEVRSHALTIPVMVEMMGRLEGSRGKEYAISVLAVVFGGGRDGDELAAPPEEVARAVELALQGECSARGRRKGNHLLKVLQEERPLDLTQETV